MTFDARSSSRHATRGAIATDVSSPTRRLLAAAVLTAVAFASLARVEATSVRAMSFQQLVDKADRVFMGRVVDVAPRWSVVGDRRIPTTDVTLRVLKTYKGTEHAQVLLSLIGGRLDGVDMWIAGAPQFEIGQEDVLFLHDRPSISPVVGFMQGRFRVLSDTTGRRFATLHNGRAFTSIEQVGGDLAISSTPLPTVSLEEFERSILAAVNNVSDTNRR